MCIRDRAAIILVLESNAGTVGSGDEVEVHMSAYLKLDLCAMHVNSNKHPARFRP